MLTAFPSSVLSQKAHLAEATITITTASSAAREHPAWRQINEIHLTFKPQNAKTPACTKKLRFSVPYQNPLILCDISRHFLHYVNVFQQSDLNKCHSWVKQQLVGHSFWFSIFILSQWRQSVMVKGAWGKWTFIPSDKAAFCLSAAVYVKKETVWPHIWSELDVHGLYVGYYTHSTQCYIPAACCCSKLLIEILHGLCHTGNTPLSPPEEPLWKFKADAP